MKNAKSPTRCITLGKASYFLTDQATGVSYRSLGRKGLDSLRGCGVYHNATQVEAQQILLGPAVSSLKPQRP
jgi:hypothetical protein